MIFSVTEMQGWRRCRRKSYAGSFNGLAKTPVASKPALRMGSIWHKGCEWWMDPSAEDYPFEQLKTDVGHMELGTAHVPFYKLMRIAADRQYQGIADAVMEVLGRELGDDEKYFMQVERDMLEAMAMNYQTVWSSPLPDGFRPIKAEQTIVVDIPGTEHAEPCPMESEHGSITWVQNRMLDGAIRCHHSNSDTDYRLPWLCHQLEMTLDGLIQNIKTEQFYILERKTYNNRPTKANLMTNDQYTGYLWGTRQAGILTYGAAYDGAWKRSEPAKGKKLTLDDLFLRLVITHSDSEIANYGRYAAETAMDMARCYAQPIEAAINYPDHRWEGCWDCDLTNGDANGVCDALDAANPAMVKFLLQTEYTARANKGRELVWPGILPTTVASEPN